MESEVSLSTVRALLVQLQSEEVSNVEKTLKGMTTHPQFFEWIYIIISNPQEEQWIKTIASSFINSVFAQSINEQNWDTLFQAIIKILQDPNIKQLDKRIFQKSIIHSIETGTLQNRKQWVKIIYEFLNNINNYDTAFLILACLAASDISPSILYDVIKQSYDKIVSSLQVTVANANLLNEMIKMWIVVFDTIKIQDVPNRSILTKMIGSPSILRLISSVYELQSQASTVVCMKEGLEQLNFLKYEVADFHKRMLTIQLQNSDEAFSSVIELTKQFIPKLGNSLFFLAPNRQLIHDKGCDDLVTSLLGVFRLYLSIKPEDFKLEDVKSIENHIIFPLLKIQDDEMYTFEEAPEDFNTLAEDCCDKQTFQILKTQAAKLLEKIGDKIEGGAQYAIQRGIESLKVKFGYPQNQQLGQVTALEVQTSFLVLSIFSYAVSTYPEQALTMKLLLNDQQFKKLPPLELARLFIFLGYNYNQIYQDPSQGQHWLQFVIGYSAHPTTVYCALDFLSNIVDEYFSEPLIQKLTDLIVNKNLGLVWEITSKIIEVHYQNLSGNAISIIIKKVFSRIEKEVQSLENRETQSTLDLINCLRVFSNILKQARKQEFGYQATVVKKEFLMTKIWPILDFYPTAVKFQVDDEVVKVATEMINAMEFIVPEFSKYLSQFVQAFKGNKFSQKVLLKLFNQYLFKADFQKNMHQIIVILITLKDGLLHTVGSLTSQNGKMKTLPYNRLLLGNTILIIQNSIAKYGTDLIRSNNMDFFHQISSICIRILPPYIEKFQKSSSSRIIYSRIFNTLFLCHMHMPIGNILDIFTMFLEQKIYHGYDTLVLALCIGKQIFKETDISVIVAFLSGLIKIVVLSVQKQEKMEKRKNKKNQTKINPNIKTIEDFDKILKTIDTPFKQHKEISEVLSNLFYEMKKGNQDNFNTVLKALPHEDFNSYQKFVNFENLQKKIRKIVKVVDIKRSDVKVEISKESNEMKDSDEEMEGPKRQRMREKVQKKGKKTMKKRHHKEEYH